MKKSFKNNGITLIALVITIIVLLILAGVTIATLTGENGILNRASDTKIQTAIGAVKEALKLEQGEKAIDNKNLTPEILLSEGKVSRTVQAGENDTYYMYYAIKENAYEGMQGLGKGNVASLKDVFLIDDKLNVRYIASNGKEYGDSLDNKVLDDETEIRFSSKAFSDYVSQISGVTEDEMKFKWMKNQTELTISDPNVDSLQDLVFFPNITILELKNLNLENLNGIENCNKLIDFSTENTKIKEYNKLSTLPNLKKFYVLYGGVIDFNNVIDSLKSVNTLKSFGLNATTIEDSNMKRISELSNNLTSIGFSGMPNVSKIEGLENKKNLESLTLKGSKISKIEGLEQCTKLKTLDLGNNKIVKVENIENLQELTILSLADNKLEDILNIDKNIKLVNLNLTNNPNIKSSRSEYTTEENKRLDKIQEIITIRNGKININIEQLKLFMGYRELSISDPNITTLEVLEGQTNLESLEIARCKNITLSDEKSKEILRSMTKLKTLKLRESNIKDLTAVNELVSLRNLYLDGIENLLDLSQIEDIISQLYISGVKQEDIESILKCDREKVTKLDISGNFSKIPDFSIFKNMNSLLLQNNKTVTNFDIISKFENLRELSLENTNLRGRMIDFTQLTNLTNLNLKNNTLWDEDLEKLKALKYNTNLTINLSNNSIINATALLELNENTRIDLSGNINLKKEAKETLKGHFQERVTF